MLSDNIRKYRKINNLSQDELAEKLDVTRQSISLWETGQTQPTIDNVIALSRIFNVSSDALLSSDPNEGSVECMKKAQEKAPNKINKTLLTVLICAVLLVVSVPVLYVLLRNNNSDDVSIGNTPGEATINTSLQTETEDDPFGETTEPASTASSCETILNIEDQQTVQFDLFTYCKNFAIEKGTINGDYSIYQQPATLYGGYDNEYFSISYWGDSNMVEFCLHCPLSETQSINFYLRMRGGYEGRYEYLSSKYYRDTGESLRSASGYIDPAVFTEKYPLSCDEYIGSADGQTEFMEESRVGVCDLIKCLKEFVEVEKMECDFSVFDFVNF